MWTNSVMRWLNEGVVITLRGNKICPTKKALCQAGRTDPAASTGKIPAKNESEINGIHRTGLWVDAVPAKRKTARYDFFRMCTASQQFNAWLRIGAARNGIKVRDVFSSCPRLDDPAANGDSKCQEVTIWREGPLRNWQIGAARWNRIPKKMGF